MLANARNVMPDELKFEGDKAFFTAALDRADLILHGRNSYEDQPNSPRRRRIFLTRQVEAIAPDPSNPKATLWNPAGASFEAACASRGRAMPARLPIIGGPGVFGMFMDRYDAFWLSVAPHVRLPGGEPCFPGVPARTPQQILARTACTPASRRCLMLRTRSASRRGGARPRTFSSEACPRT